jgi:glycine hydroxymethyltransferase
MSILSLVARHEERRAFSVNLVASENVLSPDAVSVLKSDLAHRYCIPPEGERPPEIWDYPNQKIVRLVHEETQRLAQRLFGAQYADVRPLSGNNAAYIVLKSLVARGDTIFSVPADCGGHFASAAICRHEGLQQVDLPYDRSAARVDLLRLKELCRVHKPALVFLDASMILFPYPVAAIRETIGDSAILSYDASHTFGLIGGGRFQKPLIEGADVLHGSTHKSLFGPQKAMILFRRESALAARVRDMIAPTSISNIHPHHVAALGVALEELERWGGSYADQVVANAQALGTVLFECGLDVCFPERMFTLCHQLVVAMPSREAAARGAEAVESANLHVNMVRVPYRPNTFGFRLGVSEITRRGMKERDMELLGRLFCRALREERGVGAEVAAFSARFDTLHYWRGAR